MNSETVPLSKLLVRVRSKAVAARVILDTFRLDHQEAVPQLATAWQLLTQTVAELPESAHGKALEALSSGVSEGHRRTEAFLKQYLEGEAVAQSRSELVAELRRLVKSREQAEQMFLEHCGSTKRQRAAQLGRLLPIMAAVVLLALIAAGIGIAASVPDFDEGLDGTYFVKQNHQGHRFERIDHGIDFSWELHSPFKGIPRDRFSARWEGCLHVEADNVMTLVAGADDRVRVSLDGERVIDDWTNHQFRFTRADKPLTAGVHRITVDYQEDTGTARIFLGWSRGGETAVPIPPEHLIPKKGNRRFKCPPPKMK